MKYDFDKTHVIKTKYKLSVIASIYTFCMFKYSILKHICFFFGYSYLCHKGEI